MISKSEFLSFMTKVNPNSGNKQKQTFFHGTYLNLTPYLFLPKYIEILQWLSKSKFFNGNTKVNPKDENGTKSNIFVLDIFKSANFSLLKHIKVSQWLSKSKFLNFMKKSTQAMGIKQSQTFFDGTYSSLTLSLIGCKILKYFNDFFNWHF